MWVYVHTKKGEKHPQSLEVVAKKIIQGPHHLTRLFRQWNVLANEAVYTSYVQSRGNSMACDITSAEKQLAVRSRENRGVVPSDIVAGLHASDNIDTCDSHTARQHASIDSLCKLQIEFRL